MAGSGTAHLRTDAERVLTVRDLVVEFPAGRKQKVHAVSGLDFDLLPGETLGILGESGCGKSSAAKAIMQLPRPTSGSVVFRNRELVELRESELRRARARIQMIFQDPISSLNPRRRVRDLVAEGLSIWGYDGKNKDQLVRDTISAVGLDPDVVWDRRSYELSGGQCQRISIARALLMNPEVLVCDEPVSALDVSVQAQILNVLEDAKAKYGLSMIFIAHDVSVVKSISDRVMVLYLGKPCEVIDSADLDTAALHPYTQLLLSSIPEATPVLDSEDEAVHAEKGIAELPSPLAPPSGCRFRTRCPLATEKCAAEEPEMRQVRPGQFIACHHVEPPEHATDSSATPSA